MKNQRRSPLLIGYFALFVVFLYLPILLLIIFSFNDSQLLVFPLKGFTTRWYSSLLEARELLTAVLNSLVLGLVSSFIATILGAMAAIGIVRLRFPGRGLFLTIASLPLVIPYVVLGVALLIFFDQVGVQLSLWTVGAAHVVINMPYVMLVVAARLVGFDPSLEEAAMDLGANYWVTLSRVTLPIAAPALLAAFLMSFTTSFDEFALSFFLIGNQTTLPVYLYSQLRFPSRLPLVVTLAAVIMVISIDAILLAEWLRQRGQPERGRKMIEPIALVE
jgi:spermidine/putrescine transport system permease protein